MATKLLGFTEKQFWRMTPRKLFVIWAMHSKYEGLDKVETNDKDTVRKGYIDEIF